ncbi:hypothetical protein PN480_07485 [Dolichospermum circinale CS-1225]|nr:hypothetical protein [Dolichospermum circinale]MDB9521792.1 hypothetical protein [Dolichospermum circinale CS-1225]
MFISLHILLNYEFMERFLLTSHRSFWFVLSQLVAKLFAFLKARDED